MHFLQANGHLFLPFCFNIMSGFSRLPLTKGRKYVWAFGSLDCLCQMVQFIHPFFRVGTQDCFLTV
jgi:hypothetical protein